MNSLTLQWFYICAIIKLYYTLTVKQASNQPVEQAKANTDGTVSASHLNKRHPAGKPEIPQHTRVNGTAASECNYAGMKEELKACQLHSRQAG